MVVNATVSRQNASPRQRVLETAYELFSQRGIRDVGVDEVIERAQVAKATLYHHFPSKEKLVLAFLELREQRWTVAWLEAETKMRGSTPEEELLAIFDLFDEWFHRADFEGCSFVNVLIEMGAEHAAGSASVRHLHNIRHIVSRLAAQAGLRDPSSFAHCWHLLMKGSLVSACEGDLTAAQRAKSMGRLLLDAHR